MRATEKAYLAGVIDARGAMNNQRHLRILIRQRVLDKMLPILRKLGPGGFALTQHNPSGMFIVRGKAYKLGPRKVVCYEFGVHKTNAILDEVGHYMKRNLRRELKLRGG